MIPKIIHYCWFGGSELPSLAQKCISSWRKYCPNYEIREWNETNYDYKKNQYMKQAYEMKKWGFVPDYARLDIIFQYGGVYLDTDVEIIKPIDELLKLEAFMGLEVPGVVALGLGFGASPFNPIIWEMKEVYEDLKFIKADGELNTLPSPYYQSQVLERYGLDKVNQQQNIMGIQIFPTEFFCPKNFKTGKLELTGNTYSIHHYDASWLDEHQKYTLILRWKLSTNLPTSVATFFATLIASLKYKGIKTTILKTIAYCKRRRIHKD